MARVVSTGATTGRGLGLGLMGGAMAARVATPETRSAGTPIGAGVESDRVAVSVATAPAADSTTFAAGIAIEALVGAGLRLRPSASNDTAMMSRSTLAAATGTFQARFQLGRLQLGRLHRARGDWIDRRFAPDNGTTIGT